MEKIQKGHTMKKADKLKSLPKIDIKRILFYSSGVLFGCIRLLSFAPFGIAFLSLNRKFGRRAFLALALTLGGTLFIGDSYITLRYVMAQMLYVTMLYAVGSKDEELTANSAGFVAACCVFVSNLVTLVWLRNPTVLDFLIAGIEAGTVFAAVFVFDKMFNQTANTELITTDSAITFINRRLRDVSVMFQTLSLTYTRIFTHRNPDKITNEEDVSELFDTVSDRICRKCKKAMFCWGTEYNSTTDSCHKLLATMELRGEVTLPDVPTHFRERCIKLPTFINELNSLFEIYRINSIWKNKMAENYELVSEMNRGISYMLNGLIKEIKNRPKLRNPELADERLIFNVSSVSIGLSKTERCGDEHCFVSLGYGKYAVILSDGMGHGNIAASESNAIIEILRNVLENGFDKTIAVKMLNSVMGLRMKDTYSTADICILDAATGEVEFIKIGASPAYIKRRHKVETVRSETLPVGVLANFEVETFHRTLNAGDYIVMTSDGVDGLADETMKKIISEMSLDTEPQEFADMLLTMPRGSTDLRDDVICVVVKVEEIEEAKIENVS